MLMKDSIELVRQNKNQVGIIPGKKATRPLENQKTSNIPQLKKVSANKPNRPPAIVTKKRVTKSPVKLGIQTSREPLNILEELLWKTPINEQKHSAINTSTIINYTDIINELNSVCIMSLAPTSTVKKTSLKNEAELMELQQRIRHKKTKLNGLYEESQIQLDLQRAMLCYLKIDRNEELHSTIADLCKTNELIVLITSEINLLNKQVQQLESQCTEQLTRHLTIAIEEQTQKTKSQEFLLRDVHCKLKDLWVACSNLDAKDSSHTSTSSSSSLESNTGFSPFSAKGSSSSILTDVSRKSNIFEQDLRIIIDKITKLIQQKKLCNPPKETHKRMSSEIERERRSEDEENERKKLREEIKEIKETIFIDICKETETKNVHEIKPSIQKYIQQLQETYIARESGYILQSASLELQLQKVFKEYDYLTRSLIDFKLERQKYQQEIRKLKLEKYDHLTELNDYKVIRLNESKLRKEFRELMKTVKENHKREMLIELKKQEDLEHIIKSIKEDNEIKKWEKVDKSVQTSYPII